MLASRLGSTHTEETKRKIGAASSGRKMGTEQREALRVANTARPRTEDELRKQAEAHKGEKCYAAKLTWDAVREIRRRVKDGEKRKDLANEFGVSNATIDMLVTYKTWKE